MKEEAFKFHTLVTAHVYHRSHDSVVHIATLARPWQKWRAVVHVGGMMHWQWCRTKKEAVAWVQKWRNR